ncbi:hypothetical protein AJ79_02611 [Helicocarpus griseus UAMH5409]|uniref:DUF676 domain-containing protein n=1 Tax=Helicocarpus griseus UAMH5409 TaxID=1447875 RepID=A0A2B7Y1L5_9EURO|nr:hypothetical protein AJ79_02611 [Helicocarpus griseus UAMH5409]
MSRENHQSSASPDFNIPIPTRTRQDTMHLTPYAEPLPYEGEENHAPTGGRGRSPNRSTRGQDLRSPSMQSLHPVDSNRDGRRTLLLIYIHGFVGTDTSFKKFPAHVHNLLTVMLSETHVVHSKIYPRYKTRKAIEFVRDDFSYWLAPHESSETDIVLIGHSLGGILAAEVALLGPSDPANSDMFKHRILGLINLDVPFLGLHRGVVASGIGSLFKPKEKKKDPRNLPFPVDQSIVAPFVSTPSDPNFNPAFPNDVRLNERSQFDGALNFLIKNSSHLLGATKNYISSHMEFGMCIADYPGLKRRYRRLRELEDVDECTQMRDGNGRLLRRVRFVNYYSAATGRIKPPAPVEGDGRTLSADVLDEAPASRGSMSTPEPDHIRALSADPRIPAEQTQKSPDFSAQESNNGESSTRAPRLVVDYAPSPLETGITTPSGDVYPDCPPPPYQPPAFDPSLYDSPGLRREAEEDYTRQIQDFERESRSREEQSRASEQSHQSSATGKSTSSPTHSEALFSPLSSPQSSSTPTNSNLSLASTTSKNDINEPESSRSTPSNNNNGNNNNTTKAKKDRKFCALPPREANGERDPLWVRVYMEGIDEVTAHQSLFVARNAAYDQLVGDVAARIEGWVQDDLTARMLRGDGDVKD